MKSIFLMVNPFSSYLIVFLVMFIVGCMIGYLFEVLYRRFVSAKKWVNPGFLKGPWLPLYGFGLVSMFIISAMINDNLTSVPLYNPLGNLFSNKTISGPTIYDLIPIIIIFICLILLEFLGGIIFVKGFKVRLWDYSNLRGNIMGIICPQFSLIWFIAALIYYYLINPYLYQLFQDIFSFIFEGGEQSQTVNVLIILLLGIIYGIFLIDLVISLNIFNKLIKIAKESEGLKHYEKFREEQKQKLLLAKAKINEAIPSEIKEKIEKNKAKINKRNSKIKDWFIKINFIDPSKVSSKNNYDENGRPKKIDD